MAVTAADRIDPARVREWARTLGGPVLLPGDAAYDAARRVWNLAVDARPLAIARCSGVDDIRRTLEFARHHNLPLAIRSGGHSQAGHGVCEGGIVADLSSMRAIAVEPGSGTVTVAAGARVADVIDGTRARGVMTPMGGCPDVGVGGLTLGGGENFLMARYGAVCDNVRAVHLVTADGRHLRASATEHEDLFWAVRGGGGNFGIATSFTYRVLPAIDVLSGQLVFPKHRAREVMQRYRELLVDAPDELETSGGLALDPKEGSMFFVALCFCGDRADGDALAARWLSALRPQRDTLSWGPFSSGLVEPAVPSTGSGVFLPALSDAVIESIAGATADAPPMATATWNDFHGAVTRVPPDAMAFPLRDTGFDLFITGRWEKPGDEGTVTAWVDALADALRPHGRGVYVNNLNAVETDRIPEAYGSNYDRLQALKRAYDPDNVFRVNHNLARRDGG